MRIQLKGPSKRGKVLLMHEEWPNLVLFGYYYEVYFYNKIYRGIFKYDIIEQNFIFSFNNYN